MERLEEDEQRKTVDVTLYDQYASIIFSYICQRIASPQDAEDLVLEVFLAALHADSLAHLSPEQQLAWLRRVAQNKLIDRYRHNAALLFIPLERIVEAREDEALSPEERAIQREKYEALYRSLKQLSPLQQQVVCLRFGHGLRLSEIAELVRKSEGAVRKLLPRTLRHLRALYEQQEKGNKQ